VSKALDAAKKVGVISLGSAPALDDPPEPNTAGGPDEVDEPTPAEVLQPIGLLRALLANGDWHTAQELITLMEGVEAASYPPVAEALATLVEWVLAKAYKDISPAAILFPAARPAAAPSTGPPYTPPAVPTAAPAAALPTASDSPPLSQPSSPADALRCALPVLQQLGLYLHTRPLLYAQVCRLCAAALAAALAEDGQDAPMPDADAPMPDAPMTDAKAANAPNAAPVSSVTIPSITVPSIAVASVSSVTASSVTVSSVSSLVETVAEWCLLPALAVSRANPGRVHELWRVLEQVQDTSMRGAKACRMGVWNRGG
jgi:hypothetical protein